MSQSAHAEMDGFEGVIGTLVAGYGGYVNFHSHLDRAATLKHKYLAHYGINPLDVATLPLQVKQVLTGELHRGPAYEKQDLEARMRAQLDLMIAGGVRQVVSFIDVTPDIGLVAIGVAAGLRREYADKIDFRIASHPIFGFKDDPDFEKSRWEVFMEAAQYADVIGALPEKDDRPDSIGEDEHLRRVIELGKVLHKEVHIHVDQENDPSQHQTLDLIQAVRWLGSPEIPDHKGPTVWAIHAISPSAYTEERFREVLEGLRKYNIGVVCCPRAALSMRQLRPISAPTHNSIAR
ncbi:MAG: hypothetical protein HYT41_02610, partial [Candidatus Sungbacteria bacterium]|nr:hypothetical protein [Candidatus Sungbacteria bacterium]